MRVFKTLKTDMTLQTDFLLEGIIQKGLSSGIRVSNQDRDVVHHVVLKCVEVKARTR